ncbi:MAG: alpha/beta hydrolase [Anaerolineae bacterium]|nr:alpha/beta hydrolase [Anaerolineae bacterium]
MNIRAKLSNRLIAGLMTGWSKGSVAEQRARQARATRYVRLPPTLRRRPVDAAGVPAVWFEPDNAATSVLLYLHGGAYVMGSSDVYRDLLARLVNATQLPALALDYRLAPEDPYPAALEDAVAGYRWLLAQDIPAGRILIAGDSAGGGLALATLVALRETGAPLPAGAICLSPWTDLALTGDSLRSQARVDPILTPRSLAQYAQYYAGDHDRTAPLISPLYAEFTGLPPLLIQVGTAEILLDDARRCADKARAAGVDVTLAVWEGMCHVFQMFAFLPETKEALGQIAAFTAQRLMTKLAPISSPVVTITNGST